jgi:lipopolysaccharide assembly protein A
MRRFSYVLTVPLAVVLVLFAIDNRDRLAISFWPLPWAVALPSFLALFLALLIGFLAGAAAIWLSGGKARRRSRQLADTARAQAHQIAEHERRQAELRAAAQPAPTEAGAALPPQRR